MTLSVSDICNLALDEVPAAQITSISDDTPRAEICRRQYPRAIAEMMELEWSFAIKRVLLVGVTNTRESDWSFAYAVPAGLGFPLRVRSSSNYRFEGWATDPGLPFDIEGPVIWTTQAGVTLEYVAEAPEFAEMTASFINALKFLLAAKISLPITKDEGKRDKLYQKAELFRDRALASDLNRNAGQNRYGQFVPDALREGMAYDNGDGYLPSDGGPLVPPYNGY